VTAPIEHAAAPAAPSAQRGADHPAHPDAAARPRLPPPAHPIEPYAPLIVNVCPTGPVATAADSPRVPLTPGRIVEDTCRLLDLGAAIVHLHARDERGRPTWRPEAYEKLILPIRAHAPDAVVGVSCVGNDFPELERRAAVLELEGAARPDVASLAPTSVDLPRGFNPAPPPIVRALAERMADRGIRPEFECLESGMVATAVGLIRDGLARAPAWFNLILGSRFSCPATARHLSLLVADLPAGALWAGGGIGAAQAPINLLAIAMGGHCRVGLEDNLRDGPGRRRFATNAGLVRRVLRLAALYGRRIATRAETRAMMGLGAPPVPPAAPRPAPAAEALRA
jgi:uncharacterized protein (DUF849 family)